MTELLQEQACWVWMLCGCSAGRVLFDGRRNCFTHMLFEHQVLHSLHDKLGAGIHHSGKQPAEEVGGGGGSKTE